jgi:hypothetical protein
MESVILDQLVRLIWYVYYYIFMFTRVRNGTPVHPTRPLRLRCVLPFPHGISRVSRG